MSNSNTYLRYGTHVIATVFIGFGINALGRPAGALSFFELEYPTLQTHQQLVDALLAAYGVRDIFMGLAIHIAAFLGDRKVLGWITMAAGAVAGADGAICKYMVGSGELNHWGYAPVLVIMGLVLAMG
jgi:hypothetical protein